MLPVGITAWPELTTLRRQISEMAREAVRLLIEQVRAKRSGNPLPARHCLLNFAMVKRDATGAALAAKRKSRS